MRSKLRPTLTLIALGGVVVGLSVAGWWANRAAGIGKAKRDALLVRRMQLEERVSIAENSLALRKADSKSGGETVPEGSPPPPPPPQPAPKEDPAVTNARLAKATRAFYDKVNNDPAYQVLSLARKRAEYAMSYGPFFQAQGLSSDQIARLTEILAKRDADKDDLSAIAMAHDLPSNDPSLKEIQARSIAERRAAGVELLGEALYAQLEEYERSLSVRTFVSQTAGSMAVAGLPLSREQANSMTNAIASTDPFYAKGAVATMSRTNPGSIDTQLQSILSPAQFRLYSSGRMAGAGRSPKDAEFDRLKAKAENEMFRTEVSNSVSR